MLLPAFCELLKILPRPKHAPATRHVALWNFLQKPSSILYYIPDVEERLRYGKLSTKSDLVIEDKMPISLVIKNCHYAFGGSVWSDQNEES